MLLTDRKHDRAQVLSACFGIASMPVFQVVNRMPLQAEFHLLTRILALERYKEGLSKRFDGFGMAEDSVVHSAQPAYW